MGATNFKTSHLNDLSSFKDDQEILWRMKILATKSNNELDEFSKPTIFQTRSFVPEENNQNPNLLIPKLSENKIYLKSEEIINTEEVVIQKPQNIPILAYDKTSIDNNEIKNLQKNIQNLEFETGGAFSVKQKILNMNDSEKTKTTSFIFNSNLTKKENIINFLKANFSSIQKVFFYECKLGGNVFYSQEIRQIIIYVLQTNDEFEIWRNKKVEVLKELLKPLNLEYINFDLKVIEYFVSQIQIINLNWRKVKELEGFNNEILWKIPLADLNLETIIKEIKFKEKNKWANFVKKMFTDISISYILKNLKNQYLDNIKISNVWYIVKLNLFFIWIPCVIDNEKFHVFEMKDQDNQFIDENISIIPNNQILISENNQTIMEFLNEENQQSFLFRKNETSFLLKDNFDFSAHNIVTGLQQNQDYNDQEFSMKMQKISENLGLFLKFILDLEVFKSQNFIGIINQMNEETYFTFYCNYYLCAQTMKFHKSRNFLQFLLDKNTKQRMDPIGLLHYLDHEILKPWKFLDNSSCIYNHINHKIINITYSSGLQYEGEYTIINETKVLNGKGLLKITATNKIIYEGCWLNNKFDGKGTLTLIGLEDYSYRGRFKKGKCHGEGTIFFKDVAVFKGFFINNNYFHNLVEYDPVINDFYDDGFGCFVSFSEPILRKKKEDINLITNKNNKPPQTGILDYFPLYYEENEEFERLDINLINLKAKEFRINIACQWIYKKLKGAKNFVIVHFLVEEEKWVVDGFDVLTLRSKFRIFVSERKLNTKKMIFLLSHLKSLFEDFSLKIFESDNFKDNTEINNFLEEISTKLFSLFKLKKIDLIGKTSLCNNQASKEIIKHFFNSFLIHKIKRIDLKAKNLTNDFLEVMKKSQYLSTVEDLVIKRCVCITDTGFKSISEIANFGCLRHLSITKTTITNRALLFLCKSDFWENLEKLNLSENYQLDDEGFGEFFKKCSMKYLQKLYLSWNRITDISIKILFESREFHVLKKLKVIKCCLFENFCPDNNSYLINLSKLDLSRTLISKQSFLGLIKKYPAINTLNIAYCPNLITFDIEMILQLGELKYLKKINLSGLKILYPNLEYIFKNMTKIQNITLKKNYLLNNEKILEIIENYSGLLEVNFSHTMVSDALFLEFEKKKKNSELRNLYLKNTKITDISLNVLFEKELFPQIRILDISFTEITDLGLEIIANNLLSAKLYDLNISGCEKVSDVGIISIFHYFPNSYLKKLNLSHLKLTDRVLRHRFFFQLKATIKLIMKNCLFITSKDLEQALEKHINKESHEFLFLENNKQKEEETQIKLLRNKLRLGIAPDDLENLDFSNQNFNEYEIGKIINCFNFSNLKDVNLESCNISDRIIKSFCNSSIQQINRINLSKTNITDNALFQISVSRNFQNLKKIEINECFDISDFGAIDIFKSIIFKIEYFYLNYTKITNCFIDAIIKSLENEEEISLQEISVYFCKHVSQSAIDLLNGYGIVFCYY